MDASTHQENAQIVVVDDDDALRRSLTNLLESAGFRVRTFASAERFLAGQEPGMACLVLDLRLSAMGGLELLHKLHAQERRLPTVVLTARSDEATREACLAAGALAFLSKPCSMQALVQAVREALQGGVR